MKITHHKTQAQQNAAWYGKPVIKGVSYKKPNNKRTNEEKHRTLKSFALAFVIGLILITVYSLAN